MTETFTEDVYSIYRHFTEFNDTFLIGETYIQTEQRFSNFFKLRTPKYDVSTAATGYIFIYIYTM